MIPKLLIFLGSCILVISSGDVFSFVIFKSELDVRIFFLICFVVFLSKLLLIQQGWKLMISRKISFLFEMSYMKIKDWLKQHKIQYKFWKCNTVDKTCKKYIKCLWCIHQEN